ncbi:fuconate dehydratase, partial [Mycobacterium kansasii]
DYSAAYLILETDAGDGPEGHGFVFTIGRGNDVQRAAIEALRLYVLGRDVDAVLADLGGMWRELVYDAQLRWLGPEKGVMHMAIGAVINALW